jgi:hypothetical protein
VVLLAAFTVMLPTRKKSDRRSQVAGDVSRTMRAPDKQLKASICESNLDKKEVDAVKPNWSSRDETALSASHTGFVSLVSP